MPGPNLAYRLGGVVSVVNRIRLHPVAEPKDLHRNIERPRYTVRRPSNGSRITVSVDGCKVTLAGTAHPWAECVAAERAVWAASGVTQVEDWIVIRP